MTNHFRSLAILIIAALALGACTETSRPSATGKGNIRGMHAIPTAADVEFLIEERSLGSLSYKQVSSMQEFDDLTYDFHFSTRLPGSSSRTRIATETVSVVADNDYFFALTGSTTSPSAILWETAERQWEGDETVFEAAAGHLAPGLGAVDVFFVAEGDTPVAGNARGSLSFGERMAGFEVEAGDYQLIVTAPGEPSTVLYDSVMRSYTEQTSVLFTIQDEDPSTTSTLSVRRIEQSGSSAELPQAGASPTRRFFHAALGTGNLDVYVGDSFTSPIVANLGFGSLSADTVVPAGNRDYTYTDAGNVGAVLLEDERSTAATSRNTVFIIGEPGDLTIATFIDDRRPISGFAKLRLGQASANLESIDVYLLEAGTDISDASPTISQFATGATSAYLHIAPGDYELTITDAGEEAIAAGPLALALGDSEIVEIAITDTVDPNLLDIVIYDSRP